MYAICILFVILAAECFICAYTDQLCVHVCIQNRSCPNGEGRYTLKASRAEDLQDFVLSVTKRS